MYSMTALQTFYPLETVKLEKLTHLVNTNRKISSGKYKKFQKCVQQSRKISKKRIFLYGNK